MKKISVLTIALAFVLVSCNNNDEPEMMPQEKSLYEKLGGFEKVADPNNPGQQIEKGRLAYRSVVDSTITLIVEDIVAGAPGNLSAHFAPILSEVGSGNTTNVAVLSDNLTDFFSANTGGGATNTYTGLDMVAAHRPATNPRMGANATNANYDKFIGYVGAAAGLNGVTDQQIINEVVAVLESLRAPIVSQ